MRLGRLFGLVLAVVLMARASLPAGLYDPRQPTSPLVTDRGVRPLPYEDFRDRVDEIRLLSNPSKNTKMRTEYVQRRDALLKRGLSSLPPMELTELAFLQQRLKQADDVLLNALRQSGSRDPRNYWVQTQLGTIYQAMNRLQEAVPHVSAARDLFPSPWPGGDAAGKWFKEVEHYQALLLPLRIREIASRGTRRPGAVNEVDAIFPAHFVGPSGKYEAGKIADPEKAKLPPDAIAIVQQLLLWFPDDSRLMWLLGELYNASGDLDSTDRIFYDCVGGSRSFDSQTLREHRRVVIDAREELKKAQAAATPTQQAPKEQLRPDDSRLYVVGGIGAVVVALLGWWQIREFFRRRKTSARPSS